MLRTHWLVGVAMLATGWFFQQWRGNTCDHSRDEMSRT